MVTLFRKWRLQLLFAGMLLPSLPAMADDTEGVVRLGRDSSTGIVRLRAESQQLVIRAQSPDNLTAPQTPIINLELATCEVESIDAAAAAGAGGHVCQDPNCQNPNCPNYCPGEIIEEGKCSRISNWFRKKFLHDDGQYDWHARRGNGYSQCRANHTPEYPLAGKYHIAYPVDPAYFDRRDGQVYAAAGYGGPVSVPLAPVVNHTYNYSWGIPSSRLTPVLHPAQQAPIATMPGAYPSAPISW